MGWQLIHTAARDGSHIVCWAKAWDTPVFLCWKTNPRIVAMHKQGMHLHLAESYFGDPDEMDDYDLAEPDGGPTHWIPLPAPPSSV